MNTSGSLTTRRIFGQGLDDLIARIGSSGNEDWYLGDVIGSTRDIVDYTGVLIDRLAYDAYGLVTTETNPSNGDRYKFTSREWEAEIELQYNRARYLDPKTMRWISEDPVGFDAGDSNLYRYVKNNPASGLDATGLKDLQINPNYHGWHRTGKTPRGESITFAFLRGRKGEWFEKALDDDRRGVQVDIEVVVVSNRYTEIRFIQVVRSIQYQGTNDPVSLEPSTPERLKRAGGKNWKSLPLPGWHVDAFEDATSPYYPSVKLGTQVARMNDAPSHPIGARSFGAHFVTCAIGITKRGDAEYLGSVRWGYYIDRDGNVDFDPEGGPDMDKKIPPELGTALSRWNKIPGYEKVDLPRLFPPPPHKPSDFP